MKTELSPDEVFVFGSNLAGRHEAGAALTAYRDFGAKMGVGEGLTGQCYAFPTLGENFGKRPFIDLAESVRKLYAIAEENPDLYFVLTAVGTGLAGYSLEEMQQLFKQLPENIIPYENWLSTSQ